MKDELLKTIRMPQTILLDANSRVYGGCRNRNKHLKTIGGSSYCAFTNTIYLVKEDVDLFYEINSTSGLLYVLAHEWSHSLQHAWLSDLSNPCKENYKQIVWLGDLYLYLMKPLIGKRF